MTTTLNIGLEGPGADEDSLLNLIEELGAVRGVVADRAEGGPAPEGSKALGLELLAIAISVGKEALPKLFGSLGEWLTRQPPGTKFTISDGTRQLSWEGGPPPPEILALASRVAG